MKKLAIIGASYLQDPLIRKARAMGVETHVFAWAAGDVGERTADFFYPISIVEKDAILEECRRIGVDGVATIASDLAAVTVGYVAHELGLVCNSPACVKRSTDKHAMRLAFGQGGDPSVRSLAVRARAEACQLASSLAYPLIVKPSDRSGSRGITKLASAAGLEDAVARALDESLSGVALIEEFAEGREFSVEFISWRGVHRHIATTEKFTTGAPAFIERGHVQPARLEPTVERRVVDVVAHALDSLGVEFGASHSEVKVDAAGQVRIIEIGARMGGDFIGSDLVELSCGYDFLRAVVDVALGRAPEKPALAFDDSDATRSRRCAGVRFVFDEADLAAMRALMRDDADIVVRSSLPESATGVVTDSSTRMGYALFASDDAARVLRYMPHSLEGEGA